jgi:hypothetical protein
MIEEVSSLRFQKTSILQEFPEYSISSNGVVSNNETGCILTTQKDKFGYSSVRFGRGNNRTKRMVHNLLARAFIPNPENKTQVNHIDFNPNNNSLSNLEWTTPKENVAHSMRHGRRAKKLNKDKVLTIKKLLKEGVSQYTVATYVGINQSCVSDIATGVAWSWLNIEPKGE